MKNKRIKFVSVEYIEEGAFYGGEEEILDVGIKKREQCVVLKQDDFDYLLKCKKFVMSNLNK